MPAGYITLVAHCVFTAGYLVFTMGLNTQAQVITLEQLTCCFGFQCVS